MNWIRYILIGLQFYTRIPIPLKGTVINRDLARGLCFGPFNGIVIGLVLSSAGYGLHLLNTPAFPAAILIFLLYFWLTGGIHFDGIADTFDAVGSTAEKEELLSIMKDPRIGTMGATFLILAIVNYLYLFFTLFRSSLLTPALLWIPAGARAIPVLLGAFFPYLSSTENDNKYRNHFVEELGWKEVAFTLLSTLALGILILTSYQEIIFLILLFILIFGILYFFIKLRFSGVNGDILGASIVFAEILFLYQIIVLEIGTEALL